MNLKYQNTILNIFGALWVLGGIESTNALTLSKNELVPVVAVIDTGVDIQHPILKDQIWNNPGETGSDRYGRNKANNNIDDDSNGYIDDVHGWNFLANNNNISDHIGHGTHIAGIIVSQSKKMAQASQHSPVKLMILKFYDVGVSGEKVLNATAKAIEYATKMNAHLINYSAGGRTASPREYQALLRAKDANIMVIAAAGNDHTDNDLLPFFPASYHLSNVMAVAATDEEGRLLPTSNFGKRSVIRQAPGKDVLSSLPGGKMGKLSGTSQATAAVTAQLILEKFRMNAIQKGMEEVERIFELELKPELPKTKMSELNIRTPSVIHGVVQDFK